MITRQELIELAARAIEDRLATGAKSAEGLAEAALDAIFAKVAPPLISVIEDASPFGKLVADQIRSIAGQHD